MSLRSRFLIWCNASLIAVLVVFLVMDYQYQRSTHLNEIVADTQREAELLSRALDAIERDDRNAIHTLLERSTATLQSGGRHRRDFVAIERSGEVLLPSQLSALEYEQIAASLTGDNASRAWVVGEANSQVGRVRVYRDPADAGRISAAHARWRLVEIGLVGLLATLLINLLFIRLVARPFNDLAGTIRRIGKGEHGATAGEFHSREFQLLAGEIDKMSRAIARADREREHQMAKASRLQQRLQGSGVQVPGLKVVHWHQAADHVAGDYFDLLQSPDGSWLICIADVTGHGVAAAMGAAILKTLLWSAVESGADLNRILSTVNQRFSEVTLEEDFASLLLMRWSPDSGMLQYASAGHETAYLLTEGQPATVLESTGTLLGLTREDEWEIKDLVVPPGSQMILYTDGITEASSRTGELFGRNRFSRLILAGTTDPIEIVIDRLVAALQSHLSGSPVGDDVTLVGLEFTHESNASLMPTSTGPNAKGLSDE